MTIANNSSTTAFGDYLKAHQEMFKPLSKSEEREMIQKNKSNPDRLKKLLIQHNVRLVFDIAKKYVNSSIDFDELMGRGFYGLCVAAEKFDIARNIKFVTYATTWIFKYMVQEYWDKDIAAARLGIPLNKPIFDDDSGSSSFANIINNFVSADYSLPDSTRPASDQVVSQEVKDIYSDITAYIQKNPDFDSLDREIFQRNLIDRDSIKSISADLNLKYSETSQKKRDILQKLRSYLQEKYGITSAEDLLC